jgi:hypothetical protein
MSCKMSTFARARGRQGMLERRAERWGDDVQLVFGQLRTREHHDLGAPSGQMIVNVERHERVLEQRRARPQVQ